MKCGNKTDQPIEANWTNFSTFLLSSHLTNVALSDTAQRRKDQRDMAADSGPGTATGSGSGVTKAYRNKIGFTAESPNFPGDWRQVIEKVKIADELGFDSVWIGESWGYELFTSMADLVRETKRIKVGAGIANIYSRSPALI